MKLLAVVLFSALCHLPLAHAYALPAPTLAHPYDLLKCSSPKNGTLWMSFGHLMRSGEDKLVYFPTEIALFAPDFTYRKVYLDNLNEALKVQVLVEPGHIRIQFDSSFPAGTRSETISLISSDLKSTNAFMGNWTATVAGHEPVMDLVGCTLD